MPQPGASGLPSKCVLHFKRTTQDFEKRLAKLNEIKTHAKVAGEALIFQR